MEKVIKRAEAFGDPFTTDKGTLYNIWVEFEDGTKAMAFAQSQTPPYKAGSKVEVTENGKTKNGKDKVKIKVIKDEQAGGGGGWSGGHKGGGGPKDTIGMRVGCAMNCVSEMVAAGVIQYENFEREVLRVAKIGENVEAVLRAAGPSTHVGESQQDSAPADDYSDHNGMPF